MGFVYFFQSVFKTDGLEIRKYFDPKHKENLINRFVDDTAESSIVIELEDEHKVLSKREISLNTINTKLDNLILEATLGSDFIDHKVLSRIYSYYHKEEIDLFGFFHHHLLSFINFREDLIKPSETTGSKNAERWWEYISLGLSPRPKMHEQVYKDFHSVINKFNVELDYYLKKLEQTTNEYLKNRFEVKFKIKFDYIKGTYNDFKPGTKGRSWKVKAPQIILLVELITDLIYDTNKKIVSNPQSILRYKRVCQVAISIKPVTYQGL